MPETDFFHLVRPDSMLRYMGDSIIGPNQLCDSHGLRIPRRTCEDKRTSRYRYQVYLIGFAAPGLRYSSGTRFPT